MSLAETLMDPQRIAEYEFKHKELINGGGHMMDFIGLDNMYSDVVAYKKQSSQAGLQAREKIISFSLWGTRDLYLHGALVNAEQTAKYFPGWTVHIYYDNSVPSDVITKLSKWSHIKLIKVSNGSYGMFWRFEPLFQNATVLIRDLDSRITWRDVRCVNEWLETDKKLHVVRDHDEHYKVPILGGLFGLHGPLPQDMYRSMKDYSQIHQYNMDQIWLAQFVWPMYRANVCEHGFREIPWMAQSRTDYEHMCRGYTVNGKPRMDHGG